MKKTLSLLFLLLLISSSAFSQRSVSGFSSIDQYRELGDFRLWTFIAKDSTIGNFTSLVKERTTVNGVDGFVLEQKLQLDYSKIATNLKFNISNSQSISFDGSYLADKMKISINEQNEETELKRDGNSITGYITRNGKKVEQKINLGNIKYAVENNYIDQLELFIASLDLTVGTQINDTIFMSQSLIESDISGIVEDFRNIRLYNEVFDSCFVIEFTYPTMMTAYFTPDKRLAKLVIPSQELKIYQDAVRNPLKAKIAAQKAAEQNKKQVTQKIAPKSLGELFFVFVLYLIIGIVATFFFAKAFYKNPKSLVAFFVGGGIYIFIPFTQIPLQEFLFTEYFVPHVLQAGESALTWGILPAITAGVIQELLKFIAIVLLLKFLLLKKLPHISTGAVVGFGFGLIEATYLAFLTPSVFLFSVNLVERIFLIIFHVAAGACIGYALKKSLKQTIPFLLLTIVLNSIFRFMPIFAQNKTLTPELLGILLAFISISFLTLVLFLTKKEN